MDCWSKWAIERTDLGDRALSAVWVAVQGGRSPLYIRPGVQPKLAANSRVSSSTNGVTGPV